MVLGEICIVFAVTFTYTLLHQWVVLACFFFLFVETKTAAGTNAMEKTLFLGFFPAYLLFQAEIFQGKLKILSCKAYAALEFNIHKWAVLYSQMKETSWSPFGKHCAPRWRRLKVKFLCSFPQLHLQESISLNIQTFTFFRPCFPGTNKQQFQRPPAGMLLTAGWCLRSKWILILVFEVIRL